MNKLVFFVCSLFIINLSYSQEHGIINNADSPHAIFKSVDFGDCRWTEGLWANHVELMHKESIPNMWDLFSDSDIGYLNSKQNFLIASGFILRRFNDCKLHVLGSSHPIYLPDLTSALLFDLLNLTPSICNRPTCMIWHGFHLKIFQRLSLWEII